MLQSRPEWEKALPSLATKPDDLREHLRQRGRDLRPYRIMAGTLHLIIVAEKFSLTTYSELKEAWRLSSANELNVILKHITALCVQNEWPVFTALVRTQDLKGKPSNSIGDGFFADVMKNNPSIQIADKTQFLEAETAKCHNSPVFDIQDIMLGVLLYLKRI
jgi:hypothetical protein